MMFFKLVSFNFRILFLIFLAIGISTFSKALAATEKDSKSQPILACELKENKDTTKTSTETKQVKVESEKLATPLLAKYEAGTNKEKQNEIELQKSAKTEASIDETKQKKVEDQPVKTTPPGPKTVKTDVSKVAEATSIQTEIEKKVNVELNKVSSLEKEAQQKIVQQWFNRSTVQNETEIKQNLDDTVKQSKKVEDQPVKTTTTGPQTVKTDAPKVAEAKRIQMESNKAPSLEKDAQQKIVDTIKMVQNEISVDTKVEASIPKSNTENK
jgi:hypothetical protein